jgi:ATP synthase protein I
MTDREPPPTPARPTPTREELAARLAAVQEREAEQQQADDRRKGKAQGLGLGMRIGIELLASVLVGGGLGWFIDDKLGTSPIFLLALVSLGFTAGVLNVIRLTKRMDIAQGIVHGRDRERRGDDKTVPPAGKPVDDDDD